MFTPLQWRHNECDDVSNHQPHDCLLNRLFRRRSKKTQNFRVTGLCEGNSPVTGIFPAQRASNAANVSIWWRHHASRCSRTRNTRYSGVTWLGGQNFTIPLREKGFENGNLMFVSSPLAWMIQHVTYAKIIWTQWETYEYIVWCDSIKQNNKLSILPNVKSYQKPNLCSDHVWI